MQEKDGEVKVKLLRKGGSSGLVAVKIKTVNISAKENEDYEPIESKKYLFFCFFPL